MTKRNEDPRRKGDIAEKMFELKCVENDVEVFTPINSGSRIDYIIVHEGKMKRVQIKYISAYNGTINISFTKNQNGRREGDKPLYKKYDSSEIDLFLVYCPDTDKWYNIPINTADDQRGVSLRIVQAKNNQKSNVRSAEDYIWKW